MDQAAEKPRVSFARINIRASDHAKREAGSCTEADLDQLQPFCGRPS